MGTTYVSRFAGVRPRQVDGLGHLGRPPAEPEPQLSRRPDRPVPGDAVILVGPHWDSKPGARAVIDSLDLGDDRVMAVFSPSAHRPADGAYVSVSGGTCPFIPVGDLRWAGQVLQRFWRWKDRPRAGGGVDYEILVNLWAWDGEK